MKSRLNIKTILIVEYAILAAVVMFYISLKPAWLMTKLNQWKLLPQPETLTELYFTDHLNLPISVAANQKRYFEFTVHNLEEKPMTYKYEIYANIGDGSEEAEQSTQSTPSETDFTSQVFIPEKVLIEEGEVKMVHDGFKTIGVTFELHKVKERNQVVVNLVSKNQSIHFWVRGE